MKICLSVRLPINPAGPNDNNNSTGSLLPTHLHLQLQDVVQGISWNHSPIVDIGLVGITHPDTHLGYLGDRLSLLGETYARHLLSRGTDRYVSLSVGIG